MEGCAFSHRPWLDAGSRLAGSAGGRCWWGYGWRCSRCGRAGSARVGGLLVRVRLRLDWSVVETRRKARGGAVYFDLPSIAEPKKFGESEPNRRGRSGGFRSSEAASVSTPERGHGRNLGGQVEVVVRKATYPVAVHECDVMAGLLARPFLVMPAQMDLCALTRIGGRNGAPRPEMCSLDHSIAGIAGSACRGSGVAGVLEGVMPAPSSATSSASSVGHVSSRSPSPWRCGPSWSTT